MKEKLSELIKQAKYCTAEELAEYLISAGLVLPVRCEDCTAHEHCSWAGVFQLARIENPYCCVGKMRGGGNG